MSGKIKKKENKDVQIISDALLIWSMRKNTFIPPSTSLMVVEPAGDAVSNVVAIARVGLRCELQFFIVIVGEIKIYALSFLHRNTRRLRNFVYPKLGACF